MDEEKNILEVDIIKSFNGQVNKRQDFIAVESPLEVQITIHGERPAKSVAVIMRTPGHDRELALGFLFTEGIIKTIDAIESVSYPAQNVVRVTLKANAEFTLNQIDKHYYTSSSCGVCSKASIEAIRTVSQFEVTQIGPSLDCSIFKVMLEKVNDQQSLFHKTGGIHASALFNNSNELLHLTEDVGRHNALDKLIGWSLEQKLIPLNNHILFLSGRASFELIQKAFMAAIPVVLAVGAPSSLALELAKENGQTLIGFLKENSLNIYSGQERIKPG